MVDTGAQRQGGIGLQKLSLYAFILIYVFTVSLVTYAFSPSLNPTMGVTSDMTLKDPGNIGGLTPATGVTLLTVIGGVLTSMWTILTLQIPFVPIIVGVLLAIPFYVFILLLVDMIIDFVNLLVNVFNAVTKWL